MSILRPMKGIDCLGSLEKIAYPKILQPKYDGIRVIVENGVALSASLKPLRNSSLQKLVQKLPDGIEFELVVPNAAGGLRAAAGFCNSYDKEWLDDITCYAFDIRNTILPYQMRYTLVAEAVDCLQSLPFKVAPNKYVDCRAEVEAQLDRLLAEGYEGAMLKDPTAYYKGGRSTLKSQECLKLKPFVDAEGIVIGYKYEQENLNETSTNELGLTSRSSSQLGKAKKPLIGALNVKSPAFPHTFWVSGFTTDLKERMYFDKEHLVGKIITFKYQPCDTYSDAPRHPIFRRFRPVM